MATARVTGLLALLLVSVVASRSGCPRRAELDNCTAVHKVTFNGIIGAYGSLLGGVEISQLHSLCDTFTAAQSCVARLEAECNARNSNGAKLRPPMLHNISSLCAKRGSTVECKSTPPVCTNSGFLDRVGNLTSDGTS